MCEQERDIGQGEAINRATPVAGGRRRGATTLIVGGSRGLGLALGHAAARRLNQRHAIAQRHGTDIAEEIAPGG